TIQRTRSKIDSCCLSLESFKTLSRKQNRYSVETGGGNEVDIGLGFGTHELLDDLFQGTTLEKNSVQPCDQRHIDLQLVRLDLEHLEGIDPFGHFTEAVDRFVQTQSLPQGKPDLIVATFRR